MIRIHGGRPLRGELTAPPDKSLVHRALVLAALAEGESEIPCAALGADNRSTASVLRRLGVSVELGEGHVRVRGVGHPRALSAPGAPLDCGNSGTTMRLMAGVLAASSLEVELVGDESLSRRPMRRLAALAAMGAELSGRTERWLPPLSVRGGRLRGGVHALELASAQLKSALLLAGLYAEGETTVIEPAKTRDHTERMLAALGAEVAVDGLSARVRPLARPWPGRRFEIAPDPSSAAFFLALGALLPGSAIAVRTGVNPTRTGFLDALSLLGLEVAASPEAPVGEEPVARVVVGPGAPRGAVVDGTLSVRAIDELPLLAAVAAFLPGRTSISGAAELRVKECDRIVETVRLVRAFGGRVEERPDGFEIDGGASLSPARVDAGMDHRIAMTAAVLALAAPGVSEIEGMEIAAVSFPGFAEALAGLGAALE